MGQSQLLAAGTVALILGAALAPALVAQGPLYRERWADLHLELLRERVLRESEARDRATLSVVADLLAAPDNGNPFAPAARALAKLRGVECDDAFLLRATMAAFVLPEVVDPDLQGDGPIADCRSLNLSMYLPFPVALQGGAALPGKVTFEVEVVDDAAARVFATTIEKATDFEDLRMARAVAQAPGNALADGRYRVRVRTRIDDAAPRATDPVLEHVVHVLRGYQPRVDAARQQVEALRGKVGGVAGAMLQGMLMEVNRAYAGEAFDGSSDAVQDLLRLERALQNQRDGKAPWAGMTGDLPCALPTGGDAVVGAVVRLPKDDDKALRPLVVFVGGAPAYDTAARRPALPAFRTARWVARRLGDFGLGDRCNVAWLQSPAAELRFQDALPQSLQALRLVLPTDGRIVVVLEYEAAMAASFAGDMLLQETAGAVLVGAGAFAAPSLQKLGTLHMLGVPMSGHPSSDAVRRSGEVAAGKFGKVEWNGRYDVLPEQPRPWTFGAAAARTEIAAWVRELLQLKK